MWSKKYELFMKTRRYDNSRRVFQTKICMIDLRRPHILFHERKVEHNMQKLTPEYLLLFNAITETEEALKQLRQRLILIQQQAEDLYLSRENEDPCDAVRISS